MLQVSVYRQGFTDLVFWYLENDSVSKYPFIGKESPFP